MGGRIRAAAGDAAGSISDPAFATWFYTLAAITTAGALAAAGHQTRGHAGRIEEAFLVLGELPAGRPEYGPDGLRAEHKASPALRSGCPRRGA
jgi:hypothetical protein